VLVAGLLLATAYGYFCWRVWGSPWARFQSVQDVSSQHLWSLGGKSRDALVRRLTSGPVGLFESQYGNLIPLAAMGLLLRSRRAGVWPAYVAATVLGFWLGPTSLRSFSPLPLEPRMTLPCLPGLLVMASLGVGTLLRADLPRFATLVGRLTALGVLVAAGLLPMWRYARTLPRSETPERRAMAVVRDDVAAAPERRFALVCAETRSRDYLSWFWGYKYPPNLAVLMPDELSGSHLSDDTRVYLYVNEGRARFLHQAYGEREYGRAFASRGYPLAFHVADALLYSTTAGALARGGPF